MSAAYERVDPGLAVRVRELAESGVSAEGIAAALVEDNVRRELAKTEGSSTYAEDTEIFPDEIKVIAQALAYRLATEQDLEEITRLLNAAYAPEVAVPPKGFRVGEAVTRESVEALFHDPAYKWTVVEAPSGRDVELDGVILGVCCYSTDGVSRKNGQVEGQLGSVRYFGVLPRFHGVCVGRRLLHRMELQMSQAGCVRSMACIPSPRKDVLAWLERRGYRAAGSSPYPAEAIGHELSPGVQEADVRLQVLVKPLSGASEIADGKTAKQTVLALASERRQEGQEQDHEEEGEGRGLPHVPGKMHLPPHWRYTQAEAEEALSKESPGKSQVYQDELGLD